MAQLSLAGRTMYQDSDTARFRYVRGRMGARPRFAPLPPSLRPLWRSLPLFVDPYSPPFVDCDDVNRQLAGPFDDEAEAQAAKGAIESETDTVPFVPLSTAAIPAACRDSPARIVSPRGVSL